MKIAMFTDSYYPSKNGVATSVWGSVHELKKFGHQVFVVAPKQSGGKSGKYLLRLASFRLYKEPETWVALPLPTLALIRSSLLNVDLIHTHSGGPVMIIGWLIAKFRKIPMLVTYHTLWKYYSHYFPPFGLVKPWMLIQLTLFFGNSSDAMIAPSEKVKKELRRYGIKVPIYVIPSGVELERFNGIKKGFLDTKIPKELRSELRILYVGRLEREKAVDFLIRMFSELEELKKKAILILVGEGRDEAKLKELVQAEGVEKRVFFLGSFSQSEMPEVYRDADIFVFDSKTETQGLVVLEALASGLPVVALEDPAFEGEVLDGVNGLIVKDKESKKFARSVLSLVNDNKLRKDLGKNAQESVKKFSPEIAAIKLERAYFETLGVSE